MQDQPKDKVEKTPGFRAVHKFAPISAQKVRPFADLIRGKGAEDAVSLLSCYPNRGARFLEKVLKSAIANAEDVANIPIERLYVSETFVDGGPMQRRWRAGSRGVSTIIRIRSSHINVAVDVSAEEN